MKLLASAVISFAFNPQELGLRPEAVAVTKRQLSIYKQLSQRVHNIAGIKVPELENMLDII